MNKIVYILILFNILMFGCDTEKNLNPGSQDYFIKYYGEDGNQVGKDLYQVSDGYILLGTTKKGIDSYQGVLAKTDFQGNQQWIVEFGGLSDDFPNSVIEASDGNLIVSSTLQYNTGESDIMLYRFSNAGGLIDSMIYVLPGSQMAGEVVNTVDGGYIVTGTSSALGDNNFISLRTDQVLTVFPDSLWRKELGFNDLVEDIGVGINIINDTTFVLFGSSNTIPQDGETGALGGYNAMAIEINNYGEPNSGRNLFGTLLNQNVSEVIKTSNGQFMIVGTTELATNQYDIFVQLATSKYVDLPMVNVNLSTGNNIKGKAVAESNYGLYYVLGEVIINNRTNIYIAKVSPLGEVVAERILGTNPSTSSFSDEASKGIIGTPDGGVIFLSTFNLENQTKMALVKMSSDLLLYK
ncbi:MAG: hypothetical protein OEY34_00385 [Cyclobacteriaceae bacterium]|nr:hypothetical protein [Cyclobacteriaceae bacterium]